MLADGKVYDSMRLVWNSRDAKFEFDWSAVDSRIIHLFDCSFSTNSGHTVTIAGRLICDCR